MQTESKNKLDYIPGFGNIPIANYLVGILTDNSTTNAWLKYDQIFLCCITVAVYTTFTFLMRCGNIKKQIFDERDTDGKNPTATFSDKVVHFSSFIYGLTSMVASFSMLYTVVTVGAEPLQTNKLSV